MVGVRGLILTTGLGDGRYPVDVLFTDVEGIGRRVAAVQVTFLEHEHQDEWTTPTPRWRATSRACR